MRKLSAVGSFLLAMTTLQCGGGKSEEGPACDAACQAQMGGSGDGGHGSCDGKSCSETGGSASSSGGSQGSGSSSGAGGTGASSGSGGSGGDGSGGETLENGRLDISFGEKGVVTTALRDASDEFVDIQRIPDGKMVAVSTNVAHSDVLIYRFNEDGNPDTNFNGVGSAIWELGLETRAQDVDVQSDGKILVLAKDTGGLKLTRFTVNGKQDTSFGLDGVFPLGTAEGVIAVQADDRIVIATGGSYQTPVTVIRLTAEGANDSSFALTQAGTASETSIPYGIQIDGEGRAVVAYSVSFTNVLGIARATPSGGLDTTLAGTGFFKSELKANPGLANVHGFAVQEDSMIVLAGDDPSFEKTLARFSEDGSLDTSFDADGYVAFPRTTKVVDMAVFDSGVDARLLVLCGGDDSADDALLRYNLDGSLDTAFSEDGILDLTSRRTWAFSVKDEGTAVLAITERTRAPAYPDSYFRTRLHEVSSGGVLNATFAEAHALATQDEIRALANTPSGGVYAVGRSSQNGSFYPGFSVVRYDNDGKVVTSFGEGGFAFIDAVDSNFGGQDIAIDSQGRLLLTGGPNGRVVRLTSAGVLDPNFGGAGFSFPRGTGGSDHSYTVALDTSERILVGGGGSVTGGRAAYVGRATADGSQDTSFGTNGSFVWPTIDQLYGTGVHDILVQNDQKILVTGHGNVGLLTRLTANGALDDAFTTTDNTLGLGRDLVLAPDGKVVVVGSTEVSGYRDIYEQYVASNKLLVARFLSDGSPDEDFAEQGILLSDLEGTPVGQPVATAAHVMGNGVIYVAGTGRVGAVTRGFFLRILSDGSIDTKFGDQGVLVAPSAGAHSGLYDLIEAGERLVAGGYSFRSPSGRDFALVGLVP